MICRYFFPNPQEPTRKTTSVMTGVWSMTRAYTDSLWRNYCACHSRLLLSFSILNSCSPNRRSSTCNNRRTALIAAAATALSHLLFYRTRRQSFNHFPDHQRAESLHATSAVSASNATSLRAATTRPVRDSESRAVYIERHIAARFRFMSTIEPRGRGGCCLDGWHQSGSIKTVHLARLC
jgi:hypothetical protein